MLVTASWHLLALFKLGEYAAAAQHIANLGDLESLTTGMLGPHPPLSPLLAANWALHPLHHAKSLYVYCMSSHDDVSQPNDLSHRVPGVPPTTCDKAMRWWCLPPSLKEEQKT